MKYRAVLKDPGRPAPERPIQTVTNSLYDVDRWIIETIGGGTQLQGQAKIQISDQAKVEVYVTEERLEATFTVSQAKELKRRVLQQGGEHVTES